MNARRGSTMAGRLMVVLTAILGLRAGGIATAQEGPAGGEVEYLGQATVPGNLSVEGVRIGGLSGIAYDASQDVYLAISDDKGGEDSPAPWVARLKITLEGGRLRPGGVSVEGLLHLTRADGSPVPPGVVDAEGIALGSQGDLFVASEGMPGADPPVPPSVDRFDRETGRHRGSFAVPEAYRPASNPRRGVRSNLGFESLTITPSGRFLDAATENALHQDGPAASVEEPSPCRILRFDLETGRPAAEFVYVADPIVGPNNPRVAGLVELLALDDRRWLALERSFSTGNAFSIRLYEASADGATDILGLGSIRDRDDVVPVSKRLLLDLGELGGLLPTNLEGMAFGPDLDDGRRLLILIADNNFMRILPTQVVALALRLDRPGP